MTTMTEMLEQLSAIERQKFGAEQDARVRVRQAEANVTTASQELMEVIRANEQQVKVLKAQCEKRLRDASYHAGQTVRNAEADKAAAEAHAETAEVVLKRTQAYVKSLEEKARNLQMQLHQKMQDCEDHVAETEREMQTRIERCSTQADARVHSMLQHSREVFESADAALESTADDLQDQMSRAQMRAEGRSRFRELCDLSKSRLNIEMSQPAYEACKEDVLSLWGAQTSTASSLNHTLNRTGELMFGPGESPASARHKLNLGMTASTATGLGESGSLSLGATPRGGKVPASPGNDTGRLRLAGAGLMGLR